MMYDNRKERIENIRRSNDMTDILSRYGVKVRGRMCHCPFHGDKTPSAKVYRDGIQCFTEGRKFDVIDVTMHFCSCDFNTALDILDGGKQMSWEAYMRSRSAVRKRQQEKERRLLYASRMREAAARLGKIRMVLRTAEPYSDEWCVAANQLPYQEYLYDELVREEQDD